MRLRSLWAAMIVAMLIIGLNRAPSIAASFDSAYQFESAFLGNLRPGDTGTFSVFFANTGTMTWIAGTATQVNLLACLDNKITCSVAPEEAAWNPGTWL